jgi:hypothetical protein
MATYTKAQSVHCENVEQVVAEYAAAGAESNM